MLEIKNAVLVKKTNILMLLFNNVSNAKVIRFSTLLKDYVSVETRHIGMVKIVYNAFILNISTLRSSLAKIVSENKYMTCTQDNVSTAHQINQI